MRLRRYGIGVGLGAFAVASAIAGPAAADPLTIGGSYIGQTSYTTAQLDGLPQTNENVTIDGSTESYTGVSLWTLLGGGSDIVTGSSKNAVLLSYIMATSSSGAQSLISAGEIDPAFGGTGPAYLVALAVNSVALSTPELIVPQDSSGGRDVTALTNLTVGGVPAAATGAGGLSTSIALTGPKGQTATATLSTLKSLPPHTKAVTFLSGSTPTPDTYTGATFWDVLNNAGVNATNPLTGYVLATGTDGYGVLFSDAELDPDFGGGGQLIAYADTGTDFTTGGDGFARAVLPGDLKGGRYASNLDSITVGTVPEPSSLALIGSALFGLAALRRRLR